jgi:exodeoxyribonuclease VII large subunit
VQGEGAEETIVAGLRYFNGRADVDLIITGRGGGSLEDLWPFNAELTVRAVAGSEKPVVSAVGHEIDVTLADLAADLRAPTPSAAAELAVWSRSEFTKRMHSLLSVQALKLESLVEEARQALHSILRRPVLARPMDFVDQRRQQLDYTLRLVWTAGKNRFDAYKNRLSLRLSSLEALSPLRTLARGYTVSRRVHDQGLVKSRDDVARGDRLETIVTDGRIYSLVEATRKKR